MRRKLAERRLLPKGKRGAYFFVIDAFIAGLIVLSSLNVLFSTIAVSDNPSQNLLIAENLLSIMETTTVAGYGGEALFNLIGDNGINDTSRSLIEQVVLLSRSTDSAESAALTALLAELSAQAPVQAGVSFAVQETDDSEPVVLFERASPQSAIAEARLQLSAKRLVFIRGQIGDVASVEVRMWQ